MYFFCNEGRKRSKITRTQSTQTDNIEGACTACRTDITEHPLVKKKIITAEVARKCFLPMKTLGIKRSRKSQYKDAILTSQEAMRLCREKEEVKKSKGKGKASLGNGKGRGTFSAPRPSTSAAPAVLEQAEVVEEDICELCHGEFPPNLSTEDMILWLTCELCDRWAHRECSGLLNGENVYICQECLGM